MKKKTIFDVCLDDYLWETAIKWDSYKVTYKPTGFTVNVYIENTDFMRPFRIDSFAGNKLEIMRKIKQLAMEKENNKIPLV